MFVSIHSLCRSEKRRSVQTSKRPNVQMSRRRNVQTSKCPVVEQKGEDCQTHKVFHCHHLCHLAESKLFRNHTQLTESPFLQISGGFGIPNQFRGEIADSFSQTPNNKQQQSIRLTKSFIIIHQHSSFFIINAAHHHHQQPHHLVVVHDSRAAFTMKALICMQLGCAENNKHGSDLRGRS
jgi:hypothetical protein